MLFFQTRRVTPRFFIQISVLEFPTDITHFDLHHLRETAFASVDLSTAIGLDECDHRAPSIVAELALTYTSEGKQYQGMVSPISSVLERFWTGLMT